MANDLLPTKDQMFSDLRHVLWAFAASMHRVYGSDSDCGWAVLNLDRKAFSSDLQFVSELDPAQIDIRGFAITPAMDALYEYGINGHWDKRNDWIDLVTDTQAFLNGLARFELLNEGWSDWQLALARCLKILNIAEARQLLDDDDRALTFGEVALLANMDEKSVRNAANPKSKDPLKTFIEGSRTYVNASDARDWLSRRRGFKPTELFYSKTDDRDLLKAGFASVSDFSGFIRMHRTRLNQSCETVVAAMENPSFSAIQLEQLEEGRFYFDLKVFARLASALELNVEEFVEASIDLYLNLERSRLDDELRQLAS